MNKHSIISIIEVLAAMFLGGIGVILYPQRGFSIEFAYKWVASLGFVTLFLAMEGQFMTRTITNLAGYRKKNSAHKLIYAITYWFVIFITVLCGFWASSVWSRTNISSRTLIILSAEYVLVHILLLFFISMLRYREADWISIFADITPVEGASNISIEDINTIVEADMSEIVGGNNRKEADISKITGGNSKVETGKSRLKSNNIKLNANKLEAEESNRRIEADKSKVEDRSRSVEDDEFKIVGINTGINGIILDSCDIDTEDNDWQGFISDRKIAFKQEKVEVVNVCEVNAYDKSNVN